MADQRCAPAAGRGVVVRNVGHQRARHRGAGTRDSAAPAHSRRRPAPLLFPLSSTSADELAPHRRPAGRLGADTTTTVAAAGSGLHAGASACAPPGAHRGASPPTSAS